MALHGIISSQKPIILAIENSTMCGSIAILSKGFTIAEYSLATKATHSKRLLAGIEHILQDTGLHWDNLDAIAVSIGPGSFTGLRIGLTTAKGLAMATDLKLIGVDSVSALANQILPTGTLICPLIDARKQEIYTALYKHKGQDILQMTDLMVLDPMSLSELIDEPVTFVGDGSVLYKDLLIKMFNERASFAPSELFFPRASAIGSMAYNKFERQDFLDPVNSGPIYIRKSDAELNFIKPKSN